MRLFPIHQYSPDLSPFDYHLFKHLDTILRQKAFRLKGEVEDAFKDFMASKPSEFYRISQITLLIDYRNV